MIHYASQNKSAGKTPRPFKISRFVKIDGKMIQIIPVFTEHDGLNITTFYAQKEIKPKEKKIQLEISIKSKRILHALQNSLEPVTGAELSRIGSGKEDGWCGSLSKEISRLRSNGHNVVLVKDVYVGRQRHCSYQLNPPSIE